MYDFSYHRPGSTREAQDLAGKASEGRFLAGGMTLLPAMKLRLAQPSDLIDLSQIKDLKGISVSGSELVGLMTASGPPGARLRIGSSTCVQPELYGPITVTRRSALAYAFAFAAHRRGSYAPACLVESSHER